MGAPGAVVVGTEVDRLAAKGAAVVDKRLVFLDGHLDNKIRTDNVDSECVSGP